MTNFDLVVVFYGSRKERKKKDFFKTLMTMGSTKGWDCVSQNVTLSCVMVKAMLHRNKPGVRMVLHNIMDS